MASLRHLFPVPHPQCVPQVLCAVLTRVSFPVSSCRPLSPLRALSPICSCPTVPSARRSGVCERVAMAELRSEALDGFSQFIGWCYFFAWSISFWPQTILNYRRKRSAGHQRLALPAAHQHDTRSSPPSTRSLTLFNAAACVRVCPLCAAVCQRDWTVSRLSRVQPDRLLLLHSLRHHQSAARPPHMTPLTRPHASSQGSW